MNVKINEKWGVAQAPRKSGKNSTLAQLNKKKRRENPILAQAYKKSKGHILRRILWLRKKWDFSLPRGVSERNDCAKVEKDNSNDTIVCDDDAHIVVLCNHSHFFWTRWVLLWLKEQSFKDTPHDKRQITQV